jgi:hypothetical protein
MESVKTFVQEDLTATIDCPVCKTSKRLSVAAFKNKKRTIRVRCICGTTFFALLEFRKERRKRVNLKGTYRTFRQYIHCEGKMLISDISRGGLMCQVTDYRGLEEGQLLKLDYILDDIGQRKINKLGLIRHKHGMKVGCEFIEP